jgi:hypothetical protein
VVHLVGLKTTHITNKNIIELKNRFDRLI